MRGGQQIAAPVTGQLVTVRNRQWIATDVVRGEVASSAPNVLTGRTPHLVRLASIADDARDEELSVVWELELGTVVHDVGVLPSPEHGFDQPSALAAFLHAVRWGAIASADTTALQAPFRSGIQIEDYQLDPVVRALSMPRTNLLIADDVGLGKTIEAGLVMQELMLRHRARTMLIVCPAGLTLQWHDEMRDKFGLDFRIVDTELLRQLRRRRGLYVRCTVVPRPGVVATRWTPCVPRRSGPWLRTASIGCSCPPLRTTAIWSRSPRCWSCWTTSALPAACDPLPTSSRRCSGGGCSPRRRRSPTPLRSTCRP